MKNKIWLIIITLVFAVGVNAMDNTEGMQPTQNTQETQEEMPSTMPAYEEEKPGELQAQPITTEEQPTDLIPSNQN
ncbi:MAG: hypothetical protein WC436_01300 [Candidatus Babeliales bacterium]